MDTAANQPPFRALGFRADVTGDWAGTDNDNNGFRSTYTDHNAAHSGPTKPTRLKLRPRGRWVFTLVLVVCLAVAAHMIWEAVFCYAAAGVVEGRVVHVPGVATGVVQKIHVQPGHQVKQGDVLVTLESLTLRHRRQRLEDELATARAQLKAEHTELEWRQGVHHDRHREVSANYHAAAARVASEQARLETLEAQLQSIQLAHERDAATDHELRLKQIAVAGQQDNLEELRAQAAEVKRRVDQSIGFLDLGGATILPQSSRIDLLEHEIVRLDEQLAACVIRSPLTGTVLSVQCQSGEYHRVGEPMVSIVDDESLEVVLYMPQDRSAQLLAGQSIAVAGLPQEPKLRCRVARVGSHYVEAPPSIRTRYRYQQRLLPVYLKPGESESEARLFLGQTVLLPRMFFR